MSIRSLSYFLTTAEEGNITTAAQRLHITQQTLSAHIKRLEDQYGVQLFERRPKLHLTPAGERMVHYATRIVRLERIMNAEFAGYTQKGGGILVVGCSRLTTKYHFPDIWRAYQKLYPNMEIRMLEGGSTKMDEYMLTHKADLCIGLCNTEVQLLHKEKLMCERLQLIISAELFQKHFGDEAEEKRRQFLHGVDCSEIVNLPLVLQPEGNYIREVVDYHFARQDAIPRGVFETNDAELVFKMCQMGYGASLLSESVLFLPQGVGKDGLEDMYVFPLNDILLTFVITTPNDVELPQHQQVFVDICKKVFTNHAGTVQQNRKAYFEAQIQQAE